jgi:hypothetical protein
VSSTGLPNQKGSGNLPLIDSQSDLDPAQGANPSETSDATEPGRGQSGTADSEKFQVPPDLEKAFDDVRRQIRNLLSPPAPSPPEAATAGGDTLSIIEIEASDSRDPQPEPSTPGSTDATDRYLMVDEAIGSLVNEDDPLPRTVGARENPGSLESDQCHSIEDDPRLTGPSVAILLTFTAVLGSQPLGARYGRRRRRRGGCSRVHAVVPPGSVGSVAECEEVLSR